MSLCTLHILKQGPVSWGCVLPLGHAGPPAFTDPAASIVETLSVLAPDRTPRQIYLWSDGAVTWKPLRTT
jgi:hypothetical protein